MTEPKVAPWIHLPLDERFQDTLRDVSGNRRNAAIEGVARIVEDEAFGPSLELGPKSFVKLPPLPQAEFSQGMTVVFMLKPIAAGTAFQIGFSGLSFYASPERLLFMHARTSKYSEAVGTERVFVAFSLAANGDVELMSPKTQPPINAVPYLNLLDTQNLHTSFTLGSDTFSGVISQLRIYPAVLGFDELAAVREQADRVIHPLPIGFSFLNEEGSPSLYIDHHPAGHTMSLGITNNTKTPVVLTPPGSPVSATNYHFKLSFRPGTLKSLQTIKVVEPGWALSTRGASEEEAADCVYLLATQPQTVPVAVSLSGIAAEPKQGTRSSRIQLQYQDLRNRTGVSATSGARTQHLYLINHQGRRQAPVHAGFVGSNRIPLGKTANLRLRITNLLPPLAAGDRRNHLVFDGTSRLQISFDERDGTDWALARTEALRGIVIRHGKGAVPADSAGTRADEKDVSRTTRWSLPLEGMSLEPGQDLEILLDKVPAAGAAGHSNIYIDLINIPGYWDNRFTCVVEKVAPPSWTPLELQSGWRVLGETPAYYIDPNNVVHFRGSCQYEKTATAYWNDVNFVFRAPPSAVQLQIFGHAFVFAAARETAALHLTAAIDAQALMQLRVVNPGFTLDQTAAGGAWKAFIFLDGLSYVAEPV